MINWYPGHMAKSINKIKEISSIIDLFIVVLDARAPLSTYNEDFDKIAPYKPRLFILSKKDLADSNKISKKFNNMNENTILVNLKNKKSKQKILKSIKKILENQKNNKINKGIKNPKLKAIIIGIPNSGKSTLINLIASKTKVKVSNMPGVTKKNTWINLEKIQLMDTPGILWPKFKNEKIIIKLAIIGSIKISIIPKKYLFFGIYELLSKKYENKINVLGLITTFDKIEMYSQLIKFCYKKNFIEKKNQPDINRGISFFINYIQNLKGVSYD